ncbi:nitroreductase [Lactobacillus nasalidis]|uniref:Nitroreductase n=1 Tax=Lactobacillus nasalidis TaxID=2797258 RepID=A0ABQ3W822_9LACO|nr:nitroreductase family protein [Lactobacillus nasalidis]GHV97300.1 nitroreductase [Lactobacillus nasalidis]GHV99547.1 nitroreductase [Lactobacillus nasalidis]GHW01924.1 nitroreductase [Lactobacillus nasalidis]
MKFTKLLKTRKSVRTYTGKAADKKQLKKIIEAAELAPVARGSYENYQLTVVTDPKILKEIDQEAAMMAGDLESHPLYGVPTVILVSAKNRKESAYASAGIIAHNMVMAAENKGLGACYLFGAAAALDAHPETLMKLNLPDGFIPVCGVGVGESKEELAVRDLKMDRIGINEI